MANQDQILQIANIVAPLIIGFVKSHHKQTSDIPEEGTPEYAAYLAQLEQHIEQHADAVVADIERMQREHPRT
jgi:hypothetical protein